jgi:hypothetical protein
VDLALDVLTEAEKEKTCTLDSFLLFFFSFCLVFILLCFFLLFSFCSIFIFPFFAVIGPIEILTDSQYVVGIFSKDWKATANAQLIGGIRVCSLLLHLSSLHLSPSRF